MCVENFEEQTNTMAVLLVCVQSLIFGSHVVFGKCVGWLLY
jgi:hypothetical protein